MDHPERDRQEPVEPDPAAAAGPSSDDQPVAGALASTLSPEPHRATRDRRRRFSGAWHAVTGAEQVAGLRPTLLESLALRRAHRGRVAKIGDHYYDLGFPMPGYLTHALDGLVDTGLLALAEQDRWCLRRVSLTETGQARFAELCRPPHRATAATPATTPAGGQPDSTTVEQLRWVRDRSDGRLHLLTSAAVTAATRQDHTHALCAQPIPAHYLATTHSLPTSLCAACMASASGT